MSEKSSHLQTVGEALELLRSNFPDLISCADTYEGAPEPYYSYERFAEKILQRKSDPDLLNRVCLFIDDMTESRSNLIRELLVVSILEALAQDALMAKNIRGHVSPTAADLLRLVERRVYGRQTIEE